MSLTQLPGADEARAGDEVSVGGVNAPAQPRMRKALALDSLWAGGSIRPSVEAATADMAVALTGDSGG